MIKGLRCYLDELATKLRQMQRRADGPIDNAGDQLASGSRMCPRDLLDDIAQTKWAKEAYEDFLKNDRDIGTIVQHLKDVKRADGSSFTHQEISEIKDHLFRKEHPIQNYETGKVEID